MLKNIFRLTNVKKSHIIFIQGVNDMLIKYRVENFLSFYERKEFSMIAGKTRSHKEHLHKEKDFSILKGGLIYGANAAGKSNFIKSINFAKLCITDGLNNVNTLEKHYKMTKGSLNKKSEFEFEILIDDKVYAYGFSIFLQSKKIIEEWLCEVGSKDDEFIFYRDNDKDLDFKINLEDTDAIKFEVYADDLEPNRLLLEVLGKKKWESQDYEFLKVLKWFENNLTIVFPETDDLITDYFENKDHLVKYLRAFDTGIKDIDFKERSFKELPMSDSRKSEISNVMSQAFSDANKNGADIETVNLLGKVNNSFLRIFLEKNEIKVEEIVFYHEEEIDENKSFKFSEESDGTKRLLELIPLLERVKEKNQTIFIDELERSLHPVLVDKFLKLFYENMENRKSQVIIATHESRLLDLNNIRRDEVWFTEKDLKKGTDLYSLEEYQTRFDTKLDKAYLLGRYGGIPHIKGLEDVDESCDAHE